MVLLVLLSVEQGLANSYYAKLTATTSATGKGLVYADTDKGATPQYESSKTLTSKDGDNKSFTFYVWAKPTRGYLFAGWNAQVAKLVSGPSGVADEVTIQAESTANSENNATTGTVTAQWKDDSRYSVTYKQPENGSYTVKYAYDVLNAGAFQSKTDEYALDASSGDKSVESYTGDKVTLTTELSNFQGWYEDDILLSNASSYTYEVSKNATVTGRFGSEDAEHTITFIPPSHGSYTAQYGDTPTTYATYGKPVTTNQNFTLKATPDRGYQVVGWYVTQDGGKTKKYFSFEANVSGHHFYQDVSVGCDFSDLPKAEFQVKGNASVTYDDLNKADLAAKEGSKVIVLAKDGELISGQYTISEGNTLLIPYDSVYTVKTTKAEVVTEDNGWKKPSAFRKLAMADGADITVEKGAAICVGGKQYTSSMQMSDNNGGPGAPIGPCAQIQMNRGGKITLKTGSNLYVWGFITGQNMDEGNNTTGVGTIEAQSGATVYEDIVIADWHGGNATSKMNSGNKFFPFNQYFIPNIEVPLTIHYGAALNTVSDVYAGLTSNSKAPYSVPVPFVVKDDGGLFNMKSPESVVKVWYDATTDRQHFELTGDNIIKGIKANISTGVATLSLDASNYVMPMTSNFDIRITRGTLTVPSDIALLPGSKVTLGKDATATINTGANVYIYDLDNWGLYAYGNYRKVFPFRLTKFKKYKQGDINTKDVAKDTGLADAQLVVDGTINVKGSVYTTEAGADVCGTIEGKGEVKFLTAPTSTSTTTYQYIHDERDGESISVTAVQLHNVDGSYVKTAGAAANTSYDYKNGYWTTLTQPEWNYADNKLVLGNAYPVTVADVETGAKDKTFLVVDLTPSPAAIDVAEARKAIGATDKNNILLYVGKAIGTANNVVVDGTCNSLVIADKRPLYVPTAFSAGKVSYNRTNTSYAGSLQWGTICLPFELTSDPGGITFYQLSGISGNTMTFEEVSTVEPNTPAIYSAPTGSTLSFLGNADKEVAVSATTDDNKVQAGGLTLVGVQTAPVTLKVGDNDYYIAQNKFWKPTKNEVTMNPQRAYFVASGTAKLASVFDISEGEATGVDVHGRDNEPDILAVYGVNGVKQDGLRRGINIIKLSDGSTKKIVIK